MHTCFPGKKTDLEKPIKQANTNCFKVLIGWNSDCNMHNLGFLFKWNLSISIFQGGGQGE